MTAVFTHNAVHHTRLEDFIGAPAETFVAFTEWLLTHAADRDRVPDARYDLATVADALAIPRASVDGFVNDLAVWSAFHANARAQAASAPRGALGGRAAMPTDVFRWKDDQKVEANFVFSSRGKEVGRVTVGFDDPSGPTMSFR